MDIRDICRDIGDSGLIARIQDAVFSRNDINFLNDFSDKYLGEKLSNGEINRWIDEYNEYLSVGIFEELSRRLATYGSVERIYNEKVLRDEIRNYFFNND